MKKKEDNLQGRTQDFLIRGSNSKGGGGFDLIILSDYLLSFSPNFSENSP